jgi:hypothetical protein
MTSDPPCRLLESVPTKFGLKLCELMASRLTIGPFGARLWSMGPTRFVEARGGMTFGA